MRIAIVGAGAVGGYYGARLAQAGHDVVFVARGVNLRAIRDRGFTVTSGLGDFTIAVRAEEDTSRIGAVGLVILAVKTYANREALPLLPPLVGAATCVLSLQNGVDSAGEVAAVVGSVPVLAGATYIGATLVAPGVVEHVGTVRRIVVGEAFGPRIVTDRVARVRDTLASADIQAEAVADSRVPIWEKLIFLAPVAGLTAAARLPIGPVWAQDVCRVMTERAMREIEAVARASGIPVAADVCAQKMRYVDAAPPAMRPSMMVDLVNGRPLELEALIGTIVRRGQALGVATPVAETLLAVLKPFEHGAPGGAASST